jgi:hypothetical protein
VKVHIAIDGYWPFYEPNKPEYSHAEIEVDPVTLRRWKRAIKKFEEIQNEIHYAIEAQESKSDANL